MRIALAWLVLAGCDRVFFLDHVPEPDDAATSADALGDASGDGARGDSCPLDFTHDSTTGTSYKVVTNHAPWQTARIACKEMTSPDAQTKFVHLAVMGTFTELERVRQLPAYTGTPWIGAIDLVPDDQDAGYRWVTNEPVGGQPWHEGQPDMLTTQHCVLIYSADGADNQGCNIPYESVCECDGYPDVL